MRQLPTPIVVSVVLLSVACGGGSAPTSEAAPPAALDTIAQTEA